MRGRILIVDDNADMREYLTRILGQSYRVEAVGDGRDGARPHRRPSRPI